MIYPFEPFKIDSKFKQAVSYGPHEGWDMNGLGGGNTDCGTEYHAPGDCKVVYATNSIKDYGNLVVLEFETANGTQWCRFGHCEKIMVKAGNLLAQGQVFATMGTSGNSSACHLHFDVFKKKPSSWRFYGGNTIDTWFEDPAVFFQSDTIDCMPIWVKGYFQERGIDLEQEGDARARLGEVFDESVKYQTTDKARLKAERDLAEARGDATKFEESLIQARKEIGKLEDEIRDIQAKVLSRDQRISELETAVTRLEGLIPATGTVIISSEEYASLKAKALQGVKFWGLVAEIMKRLLGRR